jgi:hypothetical protein
VKKAAVLILAFALLMMFTMSTYVAHATASIAVTGTWFMMGPPTFVDRPAGKSDNLITAVTASGKFTGSISGLFTSEARWIQHGEDMPGEWMNTHGIFAVNPATVADVGTGTLYIMINGKSGGGGEGTWVIVGSEGGLKGLHGQGTWSPLSAMPPIMGYEGQVHFDP